jgi:hypothetical protein
VAAISSTGSGNWPTCLSAPPTIADTVTIAAGHIVEIPSGVVGSCFKTIVNHTGGTTGLRVRLGGTLVIDNETAAVYQADGLTMNPTANSTVPGVVVEGLVITRHGFQIGSATFSAPLEVRGGGRIDYRGDVAAHGVARGMIQLGLASQTSAPNGRLNVTNASNANPAVFSKVYFSNNGVNGGGTPQVDGAQFLNCGSSSQPVFTWSLFASAFQVKLLNCVFDGCGRVVNNANSMAASHICRYEGVTVRNSVTTANTPSITTGPGSTLTTGTRTMWNVRSDRPINLNAPTFDWSNVIVDVRNGGATNVTPLVFGTSASFSRFEKTITRYSSTFSGGSGTWTFPYGTTADRVMVLTQDTSNCHPISLGTSSTAASSTTNITRLVIQCVTPDVVGDGLLVTTNPTNLQTINVRNCMSLPAATDHTKQSINLITPKSDPTNTRWNAEHCTVFTSGSIESGLITFGESWSTNPANATGVVIFPSVRSNLVYGLGSGVDRGVIVRYGGGGLVTYPQNNFDPAQVGWNGKFNLSNGTDGVGYIGDNGNSTPSIMNPAGGTGANAAFGQNDVIADPQFVSGTTFPGIADYYALKKGTTGSVIGDVHGYFDEAFKKNDPTGYSSDFEPDLAIDWVIDQYRPMNAVLDAAHDAGSPTTMAGATIGAAPRLVVTTPAPAIVLTPTNVRFSARQGDPSPAAQTIAITNGGTGGTGALTGLVATVDPAYTSQLTASLNQTTDPATLTLTPNYSGLVMGPDVDVPVTVTASAPGVTNSPQGATATFEVNAPLLGAAVLSVNGAPTANAVALTWAAATGGAAPITYDVQYGAGASPATWIPFVAGVSATALSVDGLDPATLWAFRVVANDSAGQQTVSNVVTATTAAPAPPPDVFGVDRRRRAGA